MGMKDIGRKGYDVIVSLSQLILQTNICALLSFSIFSKSPLISLFLKNWVFFPLDNDLNVIIEIISYHVSFLYFLSDSE